MLKCFHRCQTPKQQCASLMNYVREERNRPHESVLILASEAAVNEERVPISARVAATVQIKGIGEVNHRSIASSRNKSDDLIALEVEFAKKVNWKRVDDNSRRVAARHTANVAPYPTEGHSKCRL